MEQSRKLERVSGETIFRPKKLVVSVLLASTLLSVIPLSVFAEEPVSDRVVRQNTEVSIGLHETTAAATAATAKETGSLVVKEFSLDGIAWLVAKNVVRGMVQSIVEWINSGFQGNPIFVSNPKAFFETIADQAIGEFFEQNIPFLCSPFQLEIKRRLILDRASFQTRARCTLSEVVDNFENFVGSVDNEFGDQGGWIAWNRMVTDPSQNIYGATSIARLELEAQITGTTERFEQELELGDGFLSWRDPECIARVDRQRQANSTGDYNKSHPASYEECDIRTPGKIISEQLNKTLGSPTDALITADEIDEIIGALLQQLLVRVMGDSGLFGLSLESPEFGGRSFIDELTQEERSDFQESKQDSLREVSDSVSLENQYISVKRGSVNRVETSVNLAVSVANCWIDRFNATSTPDSSRPTILSEIATATTTATNLNGLKAGLDRDIVIAETNIENLNRIIDAINSLSFEDRDSLRRIVAQYNSLVPDLHTSADIVLARSERDVTLPNDLRDINTFLNQKLTQCRRFNSGFF